MRRQKGFERLAVTDFIKITIGFDKAKRTVTISDNGIGMSRDEVIANIGTIAKSGTGLHFRAGAGIVSDSIGEKELRETRAKAKGMLRALSQEAD